jgi:hypothetical protein
MSSVTKNHKKIIHAPGFNSVWWKCCMIFACQFDNNLFALLLFEGISHVAIVKTKVYRYNELRSELVYRIELQQSGLGAGTK